MKNNICDSDYLNKIILNTLEKIKKLVNENKVEFQPTTKNMETFRILRRELGITYNDFKLEILDTIKKLEIENYLKGPELDKNPERDLIFWIFKIIIFQIEIYLKLDIREENEKKVVLWSYHIPEYPLIK